MVFRVLSIQTYATVPSKKNIVLSIVCWENMIHKGEILTQGNAISDAHLQNNERTREKILEGGDNCRENLEQVRNELFRLLGPGAVKFCGREGGLGQRE